MSGPGFFHRQGVHLVALICGLVTIVPFANWSRGFHYDWFNHFWSISRFAQAWVETGSFPVVRVSYPSPTKRNASRRTGGEI